MWWVLFVAELVRVPGVRLCGGEGTLTSSSTRVPAFAESFNVVGSFRSGTRESFGRWTPLRRRNSHEFLYPCAGISLSLSM